jgi:hypothetical protein
MTASQYTKRVDVVRLRTLTMLSRFDGGKYINQRVDLVIKIDPHYIRYEYFKLSTISFIDEVLLAVGITDEYRISKPGTNSEMWHKFHCDRLYKMNDEERISHFIHKKKERIKIAKLLHARHMNDNKRIFNKQSLKNINNNTTQLNLTYRSIDGKKINK